MFKNNGDVSFGDVLLSEQQIKGNHNPGAGGWPTIKYFNKETGVEGAPYTKKTDKSMCDELGDIEYMQAYVEEAGSTSMCAIADGAGCSEKEVKFIETWKAKSGEDVDKQVTRLNGMKEKPMKPALLTWLKQRLAILKQFARKGKEEL